MRPLAPGDRPLPLLALVGPTGVGKTRVAVALGARVPIEVVSVDSRQIYRRMDIGTSKPTAAERRAVPHHLVDVVEPDEVYDAARFAAEAAAAIDGIVARGRLPVLVGGTGLYYRALVRGLQPRPPADPGLRASLRADAREHGVQALHGRLAALDPVAAARLHPRDAVRIVRALEVVLLTGAPVARSERGSWADPAAMHYRMVAVGLTVERETLYRALDARVDRMIAEGLLDEVRGLLDSGLNPSLPAMQGIGYRHLVPVVRGRADLAAAVGAMKRDTRRYAKRQWTWFAREPDLSWLAAPPSDADPIAAEIQKLVDRTGIFEYPG